MPDNNDPQQPHRPGSSPAPSQKLPNDIALANFIATLSSRFVMLLEAHHMPYTDAVLVGDAQKILVAAGIHHYGAEYPHDFEVFRARLEKRGKLGKADHPFLKLQAQNSPTFTAHAIDHQLVTDDELLAYARSLGGEGKAKPLYLVEKVIAEIGKERAYQGIPESFILNKCIGIWNSRVANVGPNSMVDASTMFFDEVPQKALDRYVRKIGDAIAVSKKIVAEWKFLFAQEERLRIEGQCDSLTAKRLLSLLKPDERAIIKFGAAHGIIGIDSTLSQQIVKQAAALGQKGDVEGILVVTPRDAAGMHNKVSEYAKKYPMNWQTHVWDYEKQQAWTLKEWYENAHTIYGPSSKITAPNKTP